jgi:hypothetical protein
MSSAVLINMFEEQIKLLQKHVQLLKESSTGAVTLDASAATTAVAAVAGKKGASEPKKKRSPSAYQIFMQEHLKESHQNHVEGEGPKDVMTKISKIWNTLSDEAKKPYLDRAVKAKSAFDANANKGSAVSKPNESKKRKHDAVSAPAVTTAPSAPAVVSSSASVPAVAVPSTPAATAPLSPTTDADKTEKKKKKKHHKEEKKSKD